MGFLWRKKKQQPQQQSARRVLTSNDAEWWESKRRSIESMDMQDLLDMYSQREESTPGMRQEYRKEIQKRAQADKTWEIWLKNNGYSDLVYW